MTGTNWQKLLEQASRLRQAGRVAEAIPAYEELLAVRPELPDSWYNLGFLYRQQRRFDEALAAYARALELDVREPEEAHLNRAVILADQLGRSDEARNELEAALGRKRDYVPALLNLGNLHEDCGRRQEARDCYRRALAADPSNCLALARLAGVAAADEAADLILQLRQRLQDPGLSPADRADLGFPLGRLLDQSGDYDAAFAAYAAANAANRASGGAAAIYGAAAHEALIGRIIKAFPRPVTEQPAEGKPPLFILGMFRSGSTLVEQILGSHSRIHAAGELDLIPALIRRLRPYPEAAAQLDELSIAPLRSEYLAGAPRHDPGQTVADKRPDNFLHIGLIKQLFPSAKIIHTMREPLDNLLSLYFLQLEPRMSYAHDLADAAHWYGQYRRLMAHWRSLYGEDMFDLDYDALVKQPRAAVERLLDFLGLEWEQGCLDFHSRDAVVKTASVWQVRQGLYQRSSGRWRNYARHLEPLEAILEPGTGAR